MSIKNITIYGKYNIINNKLIIDENLFFDINKISFLSDIIFSEVPIEFGYELNFHFNILLDGVLFDIKDNKVLIYDDKVNKFELEKLIPELLVFSLREALLKNSFS